MKSKRKNLLILAAALAVLTLLTFARLGNMWGWWAKSDGHVAAEVTRTPSPSEPSPTTEAFDRLSALVVVAKERDPMLRSGATPIGRASCRERV